MYGPEGTVLGATTTTASALTLANTGVNSLLGVLLAFALVAGVILTFVSTRKQTNSKK